MTKTILVLAANPKETSHLRLDQEVRDIQEGLRRKGQESFKLESSLASRPKDVRRAMLDFKPAIIHFCGHGSGAKGLAFEDEIGNVRLVDADTLAEFFGLFASELDIQCVVLNACYSETQAEAIAKHIDYVVGMEKAINDDAAIEFAVAFYDALVAGQAVEFAYRLACNAIRWTGVSAHLVPVLKSRELAIRQAAEVAPSTDLADCSDEPQDRTQKVLIYDGSKMQGAKYDRAELLRVLKHGLTTDDVHELAFLLGIPFIKRSSDVENAILILDYAEKKNRLNDLIEALGQLRTDLELAHFTNEGVSRQPRPNNYVPPQRRIRVQTSNRCTLSCPCCHWDEFEKDNLHPYYDQVIKVIENLRREAQQTSIFPRPNIVFTLTGGEPLFNEQYWERFVAATKTLQETDDGKITNSTHLLTNGTELDEYKIEVIRKQQLRKIRVSLNYDEQGEIPRKKERISKIQRLLAEVSDIDLRFNHVISSTSDPFHEVSRFVNFITKEFGEWIPKGVRGIAFIQEAYHQSLDIFRLAELWCEDRALSLQEAYVVSRKCAVRLTSGLLVEFIKTNCDATENLIARCFDCIQERDIAISADGRVRICSGWSEAMKPVFKYAYIDPASPLSGISGVIRKQYGLAGFYGHFPMLVEGLECRTLPAFFGQQLFSFGQLDTFLTGLGYSLVDKDLYSAVRRIAEALWAENSQFGKLYEEGLYDRSTLGNSSQLCKMLLSAAYDTARRCVDLNQKLALNTILLILIYLTVDEDLFSAGRTIMARGMAERLLHELPKPERKSCNDFLVESTYCVATVASENIAPGIVDRFIDILLAAELQEQSSEILSAKGWVHRQSHQYDLAISAFEQSYVIAERRIREGGGDTKLYKEIRAESQRSLGALKKEIPGKEAETQRHFLISQCLGSMDETELRYASLFSDGYSSLLKYFAEEFGQSTIIPESGYRAYMYLSDSLLLNKQFYASLIRIALLDLAFDRLHDAKNHLVQARRVFARRGLLTDQEYLNSILSQLAFLYTIHELERNSFDVGYFSQLLGVTIESCRNAGKRDIECVRDDVEILRKIIISKHELRTWDSILRELNHHIDILVNGCNKLLETLAD